MSVTFELAVPPRNPQPDFTSPPVPATGLVTGEDRRHRELLRALEDLADTVEDLEAPVVGLPPVPTAGPDLTVAAALLADGVERALAESTRLTTEALSEVVERLKTLSRQVIASAGGPSGGGGTVLVRNDTSNPVPVTVTNPSSGGLTNAELRAADVGVAVSNFYESLTLTPATGTVTPGSPLVITPTSGKKLVVWRIIANADPDNSSTGEITATLVGVGELYRGYALGFVQKFTGSTDGTLTVASAAGSYAATVHFQEIT